MRVSDVIAALEVIKADHGDLLVVHFGVDKLWETVGEVTVHPAGRPHGRGKQLHTEKVVAIGDES